MHNSDLIAAYRKLLAFEQHPQPLHLTGIHGMDEHFAHNLQHLQSHFAHHSQQLALLQYIDQHPQTNAKTICAQFDLLPGTLSKQLHHLMHHRMVTETVNPVNRRERLYSLTEFASQIVHLVADNQVQQQTKQQAVMDQFNDSEQATILRFLTLMQKR